MPFPLYCKGDISEYILLLRGKLNPYTIPYKSLKITSSLYVVTLANNIAINPLNFIKYALNINKKK